ncbi:hypothetical protein ACYPKM_04005 [Pseudomonas aeruginosa]
MTNSLNSSPVVNKLYTEEELMAMDTDDLDVLAYGYKQGDVVELDVSQINIIYSDLINPEWKFKEGGMKWVRSVSFEELAEFSINKNGGFDLEDGHHRYFAAGKLGRKLRGVIEKVKGNPVVFILERQAKAAKESKHKRESSPGI